MAELCVCLQSRDCVCSHRGEFFCMFLEPLQHVHGTDIFHNHDPRVLIKIQLLLSFLLNFTEHGKSLPISGWIFLQEHGFSAHSRDREFESNFKYKHLYDLEMIVQAFGLIRTPNVTVGDFVPPYPGLLLSWSLSGKGGGGLCDGCEGFSLHAGASWAAWESWCLSCCYPCPIIASSSTCA